ncbi:hypothetical protein BT96DRAFT_1018266 [Gymnopus androsaceus JB14]|uniref:F-box domain-containing protein n=1 Tax=Gymnopus androsaceus JB14 TaxID=1447944 RepID=A0A6A4HWL9_9AGAR|nr:hypothetical protein BT96DRAFT_1018266 [Gymnopus androsaceus JB14]
MARGRKRALKKCHIDRVPDEILLEIFRFSNTRTPREFERKTVSHFNIDSAVLSLVTARWPKVPSSVEAFVKLYLERSKDAALDICILFSEDCVFDNYSEVESEEEHDHNDDAEDSPARSSLPILSILLQHAHRWRTAVMQLPESVGGNTTFPSAFPSLEELDVRCMPENDAGMVWCPTFHAPLLRKLSVEKFCYGGKFGSSCLDYMSLTWITPDTVTTFLEEVSVQCIVEIFTVFTPYTNYGTAEVTSPLKALSITATGEDEDQGEALATLLTSLTLPNMEKLTLINESGESAFPVNGLLSMLDRSQSSLTKLTHLHFERCRFSDGDLLRILEKIPALTGFIFEEKEESLTGHFFQSLMGPSLKENNLMLMVPSLMRVVLKFHSRSIPFDELLSFIESRRQNDQLPNRVLRTAVITIPKASSQVLEALEDRLSKLRSDGVVEMKVNSY